LRVTWFHDARAVEKDGTRLSDVAALLRAESDSDSESVVVRSVFFLNPQMFLAIVVGTVLSADWSSVAAMSGSGVTFDHPAAEAVAGMASCLDALAEASVWSMPTGELARLLVGVEVVARRLDAARMGLAA
jgi:hypothetical protein